MIKSNEWRQFEQLVSRIEAMAGPKNAIVKSPDRIRDLVTGTMREVDASIRHRVGTIEVLITIECRKRGRKSDDTWIEQLATKRGKIGAAKTIAVSSTGFSDSAHRTAKMYGIELRTLSEVDASSIEDWFILSGGIAHGVRHAENIECVVFLQCDDGSALDQGLLPPSSWEPVFECEFIQSPFPAVVLWGLIARSNPECFQLLPNDGSSKKIGFKVVCSSIPIFVRGEKGLFRVHHFNIWADVGLQVTLHPLDAGKHHMYSLSNGKHIQHSSFKSDIFGTPLQIDMQHDPDGLKTILWKFPAKKIKKLPDV